MISQSFNEFRSKMWVSWLRNFFTFPFSVIKIAKSVSNGHHHKDNHKTTEWFGEHVSCTLAHMCAKIETSSFHTVSYRWICG